MSNWLVKIYGAGSGAPAATRFVPTDHPVSVLRAAKAYNDQAILKQIYQELNGHEEALLLLGSSVAHRTLVEEDKDVDIDWLGGSTIFKGLLTGSMYKRGLLEPYVYERVHTLLDGGEPFDGEYNNVAANTILAAILPAGVSVGECPTTPVSATFIEANRLTSAIFLSDLLALDYWPEDGNLFNIGNRGKCKLQLKLDENSGLTANDKSGSGNNFTLAGGAATPTWVDGKFGAGLSFDGGDYLSRATKVIETTEDFSAVVYIDPDTVSGSQTIVRRQTGWIIRLANAEIEFYVWTSGTDVIYLTNNASLSAGAGYYRIGVSFDVATLTAKIYLNGVECTYTTEQQGTGTPTNTDNPIYLGSFDGTLQFYTGDIDEIQFFQRELNDEEQEALNGLVAVHVPERGVDRSKIRNHALVAGVGPDGRTIYGEAYVDATTGIVTAGAPGGGFVKKTAKFQEKKTSLPTELNNIAVKYLNQLLLESSGVRVHVPINKGFPLEPGYYCVLEDAELKLGDVYRIQARTVTLALVELEIDRMVSKSDSVFQDLSKYEELGIYTVSDRGRIGGGSAKVYRLIGESETGYDITETGTGSVILTKDYLQMMIAGAGVGRAIIESTASVNFANDPSFVFTVKQSPASDPDFQAWLGLWNSGTEKGIFAFIILRELWFIVYNGPGNTTQVYYDNLIGNTLYKIGMYKRGDVVHCYVNDIYFTAIDTDVPTTGSATPLYLDLITLDTIPSSIMLSFDLLETETLW